MDGSRFDSLTRALGTARSRRAFVAYLAVALAGAIGLGGSRRVTAFHQCETDRHCLEGQVCRQGYCRCRDDRGCPNGYVCRDGGCLCTGDRACSTGQVCRYGVCFYPCTSSGRCPGGLRCYRAYCHSVSMIGWACLKNGPPCPGGSQCVPDPKHDPPWGECQCAAGETVCGHGEGAYCASLATDKSNCGACRAQCPDARNTICRNGSCICKGELTLCGKGVNARCRDLQTDPFHCGRCSRACLVQSQRCKNGRCCNLDGVACPEGCGPGGRCKGCCSGVCRLDGTCGQISESECLATAEPCPGGCAPQKPCPGCCDRTCNASGMCSPQGCAFGTQPCDDNTPCCSSGPLDGDGAFICKDNGGPTHVCWWN